MNPIWIKQVAECENYRDLLKLQLSQPTGKKPKSWAGLAKSAGFSSKSFLRDMLAGKKRLTARSLPKVIKAFKLEGDVQVLFEYLVKREEEDIRQASETESFIKKQLSKTRRRILNQGQPQTHTKIYEIPMLIDVYAALGSTTNGVTVESVAKKTKFSITQIHNCLATLIDYELVRKTGVRYLPTENHLIFNKLGSEDAFKSFYEALLHEALGATGDRFKSEQDLFFASVLSVKKTQLPEIRHALRNTLLRFIDENEDEDGESLVHLSTTLLVK